MHHLRDACLFIGLLLPSVALAADDGMTDQEFYRLTAVLMANTSAHDKVVEDCSARGLQSIDQRTRSEVSKLNGMSAEDAIRESCRRLVKGIAAGQITYTTYLEWMNAEPGTIKLPDYK
jgi:hypothetical protein